MIYTSSMTQLVRALAGKPQPELNTEDTHGGRGETDDTHTQTTIKIIMSIIDGLIIMCLKETNISCRKKRIGR